jgi:hypothetical protein
MLALHKVSSLLTSKVLGLVLNFNPESYFLTLYFALTNKIFLLKKTNILQLKNI